MNYPLIKKAYEIDLTMLEEGFLSDTISCHAETRGQAKYILLKKIKYDSWKLKFPKPILLNGRHIIEDEVTFLTIPIKRYPEADLLLFEGNEVTLNKIEEILKNRKRMAELDTILANESIQFCYITKGSYYYRPGNSGYTEYVSMAGFYTTAEAVASAKSCRELHIIPIDIEKHNAMINERIEDLKTRLINPTNIMLHVFPKNQPTVSSCMS